MMTIKTEYQVKKNWMGDPCLPENYRWTGLNCQSDGSHVRSNISVSVRVYSQMFFLFPLSNYKDG